MPSASSSPPTSSSAAAPGSSSAGATSTGRTGNDRRPVIGDEALLERAFANIIANAVTYSQGEPVLVHAGLLRDGIDVRVADRGPGVPPQERETIFLPFRRVGDTRRHEGAGLGLAIAKGFVEAMGGTIEADDTPGGGLTMVVRLKAKR